MGALFWLDLFWLEQGLDRGVGLGSTSVPGQLRDADELRTVQMTAQSDRRWIRSGLCR